MDFEKRLEKAISRGAERKKEVLREKAARALTEDELRSLHMQYRAELSDYIEHCIHKLVEHLPGFRMQSLMGEDGWGAKITRDDFVRVPGKPAENRFSRLEMAIRPFSPTAIVELVAKASVRNKEIFQRAHYAFVAEFDPQPFIELIDTWLVEFAEQYVAQT